MKTSPGSNSGIIMLILCVIGAWLVTMTLHEIFLNGVNIHSCFLFQELFVALHSVLFEDMAITPHICFLPFGFLLL